MAKYENNIRFDVQVQIRSNVHPHAYPELKYASVGVQQTFPLKG